MSDHLHCNNEKCHRQLEERCWMSSCCHFFCNSCGEHELLKNGSCPACGTAIGILSSKLVDLHIPTESRKLLLAGLRPEVAISVANKAIAVWMHQMRGQLTVETQRAGAAVEKAERLERKCNKNIPEISKVVKEAHLHLAKRQNQLNTARAECAALEEAAKERETNAEFANTTSEKSNSDSFDFFNTLGHGQIQQHSGILGEIPSTSGLSHGYSFQDGFPFGDMSMDDRGDGDPFDGEFHSKFH